MPVETLFNLTIWKHNQNKPKKPENIQSCEVQNSFFLNYINITKTFSSKPKSVNIYF